MVSRFKKILLWVLAVLLILLITGVFVSIKYADKIEKLVIEELNRNLNRPVSIKDVEFTLWSKFPKASVKITEVNVEGLKKSDPPFINAKNVFLAFDFLSLFKEEILINEIDIEKGQINVLINSNGQPNYLIFKENKKGEEQESILKIEHINLLEVNLNYKNIQSHQEYELYSDESELSFSMGDEQQFVIAEFEGDIKKVKVPGYFFNEKVPSEGNLELIIQPESVRYLFTKGEINGQQISVDGKYNKKNNSNHLSYLLADASLEKLLPFFPKNEKKSLMNYHLKGDFSSKGILSTSSKGITSIKGTVILDNGSFNPNKSTLIHNVLMHGNYVQNDISNFSTAKLEMSEFSFDLGSNSLSGNGSIKDFKKLHIDTKLKGKIEMSFLCESFATDKILNPTGTLLVNAKVSGYLMDLIENKNLETYNQLNSTGDIELQNFGFSISGQKNTYQNISGRIQFDKENIQLEGFTGKINSTDFTLEGKINDYLNSLMNGQALDINASVNAGNFIMEDYIQNDNISNTSSSKSQESYSFFLPKRLKLNLGLSLRSFTFREFKAKEIKGKVKLENEVLTFEHLDFLSSDGQVNLKGRIANTESRLLYEGNLGLKNINLKKLFTEMENFGQEFLQAKHLKGNLDSEIYFLAETDSALNFKEDKIYTKAQIKIKNGELNQLESLVELEKYLKTEFRIDLALADLKFNNLENNIEIVNRVIYIPEMKISSSALSIDISGTHSFDQAINYLLKVKASEIFKAKNNNSIDQKYGVIENDEKSGTLPILMTGTVDNPKFSYDMKTKKVIIKENIQEEKRDIKNAFQKEINEIRGIKDTIPPKKTNHTKFQVEWEE